MAEKVLDKIPNKHDSKMYCVYTNYEGDHTQPYSVVLGARVNSSDQVPAGMTVCDVPNGDYAQFVATGDLTAGAVANAWYDVWKADLDRSYQADFECYDERAADPKAGEVDIFVGLK